MGKISAVIHTWNEEKNLPRALACLRGFADEVMVVDMYSTDGTREVAKKHGAKVYSHELLGYVEPARNFAVEKATGDWILILDADEELPATLATKLKKIAAQKNAADFYRLPRKNIIFGKWIRHSLWWPDYQIRFFKKGQVTWSEVIHAVPETRGVGLDLPLQETFAIIHYNYEGISQYIQRADRYTSIQAKFKVRDGYKFLWQDLIRRPVSEFLSRFFVGEAYRDGVHGLVLSLLQAFSEALLYIKVWEVSRFKDEKLKTFEIENEITRAQAEFDHWLFEKRFRQKSPIVHVIRKIFKK